ncbi:MAG: ATP-binding protein [Candidatus Magnetomorum sp.]|nr:ATP-binding protein [Candidatus Magnetomorum sp.]
MNYKNIFTQLILDFQQKSFPNLYQRCYKFPEIFGKAISLIGPRRSGKTFLIYLQIKKLLSRNVPKTSLVYINFEDNRLTGITISDLENLLTAYFELFPFQKEHTTYLFLDEVQVVEGWEKFVRRVLDHETMIVFITGSSAKMLGTDLSTALRGRTLPFTIMPLSLIEYALFHKVDKSDYLSSRGQAKWGHLFNSYAIHGGYPEIVSYNDELKRRVLNDYLDLMIYRDIFDRYTIKNHHLFKYILTFLIHNISNRVTVNKLYKDVKSQGISVSRDTIFQYFSYIENALLFFFIPGYSLSVRKQQVNPKKIYIIDPGFFWIYASNLSQNKGRVLENIVFLELYRQGFKLFYYHQKDEIDFLAIDENGVKSLFQVCIEMSDMKTRNREIGALLKGLDAFNLSEGTILTESDDEIFTADNKTITIIPFWKWLIDIKRVQQYGYVL